MRSIAPALQAHLDSGVTTLCHCWRLTLKSGEVLGFTDHDVALSFEATVFEAQAGFTASEMEQALGLSVDNLEAEGALSSTAIDAVRLKRGDYDHATIEIWRVNWADVSQRVLLRKGHLGEITHDGSRFSAELRGLTHLLDQERGRLFSFGCDAELGDARCGVDLELPTYRGSGSVTSVTGNVIGVSGLAGFVDEWFTGGTCMIGARKFSVKRHRNEAGVVTVTLWQEAADVVSVGTPVVLRAGCDKRFETCRNRFSNAVNFRGFPHMPGNDFVARFASSDQDNDGGRMRR
jgi:uncharacterized phage protein (TIGR02218 family)